MCTEAEKKPFPWDLMDVKPLHDFKKVAEPIHTRKKSTVGIKCKVAPLAQEALCHEREGLGHHCGAGWLHVCPGPTACLDQMGTVTATGHCAGWISDPIWLCAAILTLSCRETLPFSRCQI